MTERDDAALDAAVLADEQRQLRESTAEPAPGQPVDKDGHPAGDHDGLGGTAPEDAATYDPGKHNVDEVNAYLALAADAERQRVLDVEGAGKARKGVLEGPHQPTVVQLDDDQADDDTPQLVHVDGLAPREALPGELTERDLAPVERDDATPEGEGSYDQLAKLAPREPVKA